MSYSDADRRVYNFDNVDFGASDVTDFIIGPKGKKGRLVAFWGSTREVFTATTLHAQIQIGTASDADAYALFDFGTMADNHAWSSDDGVSDTDCMIQQELPADTEIKLTFQSTTGGSPTGQSTVSVMIDWAW
jgi:hypothetical protein